ncbi:MAG TPA: hypothetical protein VK302_19390 [Terriglobales bacterium]|nr:hypothetical protein [Terriglobales bacterium]
METTVTKQAREKSVNPAALSAVLSTKLSTAPSTPELHLPPEPAPEVPSAPEHKSIGYGMPCSHCRAYYPADMHVCPICKSSDRISPTEPAAHSHSAASAASQPASQLTTGAQITGTQVTGLQITGVQIDDDRERFLKELKSQAFASHTQINATATFRCVLEHQHSGASEPAAVCHSCYGEARQQADRMEAALHMDTKEAAKIVYEAVWADTSDPNSTYLNAASALLSELRKRAGIGLLLGANQPLAH